MYWPLPSRLARWRALLPPRPRLVFRWDAAAAGLLAAVLLSPIVIAAARMAPGDFPPVFYNVDTAYFLEQVQSLTKTRTYPPESLEQSWRPAFVPLRHARHGRADFAQLRAGSAPVAVHRRPAAAGRRRAGGRRGDRADRQPSAPDGDLRCRCCSSPSPSFWYALWHVIGPDVWAAVSARTIAPLEAVTRNYELWGVASIGGQNVGAHFLVLASLAAIAAAPVRGWRLPVFLIGTGILVKTSAGVALLAGFLLVELWRSLAAKRFRPSTPAVAVVAVFAATYFVFWIAPPVAQEFAIEPFALFHLTRIGERGRLIGLTADLLWLFLPVLIVGLARARDPEAAEPAAAAVTAWRRSSSST